MFGFAKNKNKLNVKRATKKLKPLVDRLNRELKEPFVIGGGCVRDLLLGKVPKDYDVFVDFDYGIRPSLRPTYCPNVHYGELGGDVQNLGHHKGIPIELIIMKPEIEITNKGVCDRMDIGICRVSIDWQMNLYISPEALSDFKEQTLTVIRLNSNQPERVRCRLDRLAKKFPNHKEVWLTDIKSEKKPMLLRDH